MKNNIRKSKIIIDKLYMEWIKYFLRDKSGFTSDFYKYNNDGVSNLNVENVNKLESIFRIVEEYADHHNIEADEKGGKFITNKKYYIKYNENIYAIGYMCEDETTFYCYMTTLENNITSIDYDDLEKYQTKENTKFIETTPKNYEQGKKVRRRTL